MAFVLVCRQSAGRGGHLSVFSPFTSEDHNQYFFYLIVAEAIPGVVKYAWGREIGENCNPCCGLLKKFKKHKKTLEVPPRCCAPD